MTTDAYSLVTLHHESVEYDFCIDCRDRARLTWAYETLSLGHAIKTTLTAVVLIVYGVLRTEY
jgi:hypothetical protein